MKATASSRAGCTFGSLAVSSSMAPKMFTFTARTCLDCSFMLSRRFRSTLWQSEMVCFALDTVSYSLPTVSFFAFFVSRSFSLP